MCVCGGGGGRGCQLVVCPHFFCSLVSHLLQSLCHHMSVTFSSRLMLFVPTLMYVMSYSILDGLSSVLQWYSLLHLSGFLFCKGCPLRFMSICFMLESLIISTFLLSSVVCPVVLSVFLLPMTSSRNTFTIPFSCSSLPVRLSILCWYYFVILSSSAFRSCSVFFVCFSCLIVSIVSSIFFRAFHS